MTDIFHKEKRSAIMRSIKSRDTKPEIIVRKFLHRNGFRYKLHDKKLPGKPDIKLSKYKTVIFVNGCFWHKHNPCYLLKMPKSNLEYWDKKLEDTVLRDTKNLNLLKLLGWRIIIIWECELKKRSMHDTLLRVINILHKANRKIEQIDF